jgi:hypothetical protein
MMHGVNDVRASQTGTDVVLSNAGDQESSKATTRGRSRKSRELAEWGYRWLVIVNCPSNPEKTGGLALERASKSRRSLTLRGAS